MAQLATSAQKRGWSLSRARRAVESENNGSGAQPAFPTTLGVCFRVKASITMSTTAEIKPSTNDGQNTHSWRLLVLPTAVLLCLIFMMPIADLIQVSFHQMAGPGQVDTRLTTENYWSFVTDRSFSPFFYEPARWGCWLSPAVSLSAFQSLTIWLTLTPSRWRGFASFWSYLRFLSAPSSAILAGTRCSKGDFGLVNTILLEGRPDFVHHCS